MMPIGKTCSRILMVLGALGTLPTLGGDKDRAVTAVLNRGNQPDPACAATCTQEGRRLFEECRRDGRTNTQCFIEVKLFVERCIRERCLPPPCAPRNDGLACKQTKCPETGEHCIPEAIECNADGQCRVVECNCGRKDHCRLRLPRHGQIPVGGWRFCTVPCPDGQECREVQTPLENGNLRITCDCAPLHLKCAPDSENPRECSQVQCSDPKQKCIPTKLLCLPGAGCRVIECECSDPEECHVTVGDNGGPVCVGSCPDGTECRPNRTSHDDGSTEVQCDCVPVVTECRRDLNAAGELICTGDCPPGQVCREVQVTHDDGTVTLDCDCVDMVTECHRAMNADGTMDCRGTCPPGQVCREIQVTHDDGTVTLDCDCVDEVALCRQDVNAAGELVCMGSCPPLQECREIRIVHEDGTVTLNCDCVPVVPPCLPDPTSETGCQRTVCPDPTQRCTPTKVLCIPGAGCRVIECDCNDPVVCHVAVGDNAAPMCVGVCLDGAPCRPMMTQHAAGAVEVKCRCDLE